MALQKSKRLKASPSVQYPWRWENLIIRVLDCNPSKQKKGVDIKLNELVCYLLGASFMNINPALPVEIWEKIKEFPSAAALVTSEAQRQTRRVNKMQLHGCCGRRQIKEMLEN